MGMFTGPNQRMDVGGRYWGEWPGSSRNVGKMRLMVNGSELAIEPERVLRYADYMKKFKEGALPKEAAGMPWFLEHG
jgi:hypothetical protein